MNLKSKKFKKKATKISMLMMVILFVGVIIAMISIAIGNYNDEKRFERFSLETRGLITDYLAAVDTEQILETNNSTAQLDLLDEIQASIDTYKEKADETHELNEVVNMQSLANLLVLIKEDAQQWDEIDEQTRMQYELLILSAQVKNLE